MTARRYGWRAGDQEHELQLVPVPGTAGTPYLLGAGANRRPIEIRDFYIATTPVTQALWTHVMGANPSKRTDIRCPVENVSWHHVVDADGFLDRINASEILVAVAGGDRGLKFRLPSESEWEYAARGGPHWKDDFAFAGSNNPDEVAWYGPRWGLIRQAGVALFGWKRGWKLLGRPRLRVPTRTHDVATKKPNQLGLYDMCGNVWEWCQDTCVDDIASVPADGSAYLGVGDERRLRGGCHHNWDLHCRVWWRYGITPDAHDGCIGVRLVLS